MSKVTKKILKSILLSSVMSLMHTEADALPPFLLDFEQEGDESDQVGEIKRRILKNVVKINSSGRMTMVNDHYSHRSHSSHRSHYSSRGGHSSHSSHYSSSHTSHYSSSSSSSGSSRVSGLYSTPKVKTPADYSFGDRTIQSGIYGADVDKLAELLVSKYYLKRNAVAMKSGYALYDTNMSAAIKHFQRDAGLSASGIVDNTTSVALQTWDENKTTIDLGFRDITDGIAGYDVSQLIKLLTAAGYAPESSKLEYKSGNAVFNSEVAMALKMFQAYNQLEVTGIPDTQAITKLKKFKK